MFWDFYIFEEHLFYGTLISECLVVEATLKSHWDKKNKLTSLSDQSILI